MVTGILPLYQIFQLNTTLFANTFDSISDRKARIRLNGRTNNLIFIACHLVDARYYLANLLGDKIASPHQPLFDAATGIEDFRKFPSVNAISADWRMVSQDLLGRLEQQSEEQLAVPAPADFPVDDKTLLGGIAFLTQHESYHIGQMAFIRKSLGKAAMEYS